MFLASVLCLFLCAWFTYMCDGSALKRAFIKIKSIIQCRSLLNQTVHSMNCFFNREAKELPQENLYLQRRKRRKCCYMLIDVKKK